MSKILVAIQTDHKDSDDAIRAVISNLEGAGYNYQDYEVGSFAVIKGIGSHRGSEFYGDSEGFLQFAEPEVDPLASQH